MAHRFRCFFPRGRVMRDFPMPSRMSDESEESAHESEILPKCSKEPFRFVNFNFGNEVSDEFCKQKEEGLFLDCTVITENDPILAHQTILAAVIPYFDRFFRFKEEQEHGREFLAHRVVDLSDLDPKSVAALIDYAYRGEIMISMENVPDLLPAADFLCLEPVSTGCVKLICNNLDFDTWLSALQFASSLNNFALTNHVKLFVLRRFSEIEKTEDFLRMDVDFLLDILRSDELIVTEKFTHNQTVREFFVLPARQEELILNSVVRYALSQSERFQNEEFLVKILSEGVRLPLIPTEVLKSLRCNELFAVLSKCLAIIDDAILIAERPAAGRGASGALPATGFSPACIEHRKSSVVESLLLGCVTGTCSQGSLSVSLDSLREEENLGAKWSEPRSLAGVLTISFTEELLTSLTMSDVWPAVGGGSIPELTAFDDSSLSTNDQSVFYVTGMKLHIRNGHDRSGYEVIEGILVTYSNSTSVFHGCDNSDMAVEEFNLAPDERITAIHAEADIMLDTLRFTTNKGSTFGPYGRAGGVGVKFAAPAKTGYLAYVKGKVQLVENRSIIRQLQFAWAYNSAIEPQ